MPNRSVKIFSRTSLVRPCFLYQNVVSSCLRTSSNSETSSFFALPCSSFSHARVKQTRRAQLVGASAKNSFTIALRKRLISEGSARSALVPTRTTLFHALSLSPAMPDWTSLRTIYRDGVTVKVWWGVLSARI